MTRFAQTPRKHFDDGRSEPALDHSRSSYPLQPGMIPWEITAMERAWVLLKSGRRINLLQPTASDWDDEDLALGLARTYRWGGHSTWELPLSVAQHSLTVLALRQAASAKPLARAEALRELLHDAEEGFLSWDPIAPIKPYLGTQLRSLMRTMEEVIAQRYGLPEWTTEEYAAHKHTNTLIVSLPPVKPSMLSAGLGRRFEAISK